MPVVVQKFGGTSVADAHRIHLAARRAVRAKLGGRQVVLTVSAMGATTDTLVELAYQVSRRPSKREMDMLLSTGEQVSIALVAMAIHEAGHEAISMTGAQAGLLTDSRHTGARIRSIDADKIREQLDTGRIVIVAGFQGVDDDLNITTLGRGGSDTTAVALAAALRAQMCEIYTDVDGVYTTDPRIVPEARKIDRVSYDEMLELASLGAGVMHPRSIELAKKYNVNLHVRSSLTDNPGTIIMETTPDLEQVLVSGVTLRRNVARVSLFGLPIAPETTAGVFAEVSDRGILVDDIVQNPVGQGERINLAFTVDAHDIGTTQAVAELLAERYPGATLEVDDQLARISVVGIGMRSHGGVAAKMFRALADESIAIQTVSTSEIVISAIVRADQAERALKAVHKAFELG